MYPCKEERLEGSNELIIDNQESKEGSWKRKHKNGVKGSNKPEDRGGGVIKRGEKVNSEAKPVKNSKVNNFPLCIKKKGFSKLRFLLRK